MSRHGVPTARHRADKDPLAARPADCGEDGEDRKQAEAVSREARRDLCPEEGSAGRADAERGAYRTRGTPARLASWAKGVWS